MRLGLVHRREQLPEKESSMERVHALILDDTAASSVEYGLLLAGIALAVLASIMGVGQAVMNNFYTPALSLIH
jgi:Flp pilus assembly pilin Flp